ncbi:hypothetical protein DPMN_071939 [Dreissena polymorpha]|uniref:protein-tyrosine-phosphatase n=1 Tax=Dreissena polymorpha TaxID=45954 RepID=A0A9D3Z5L5_DREPO|nr:hypothetical protein DPMN_071939 [Dreissena polymorpha]
MEVNLDVPMKQDSACMAAMQVKVLGEDTDYINASFIDLGDFRAFWKMVWQQKVEKVVMVTNLVEEGTVKCEQYWPDASVSQVYGDIRVVCQSENHYAEFTRRTFTVMKANEERILHHLHFTVWPDKDVPEDEDLPLCTAGVGRTGTYIAIDTVTKEGESEGAVDIAGCVLNMRQNRPNMVQTAGQYEYIHHAVVHSLTFDCKHVAGEKFQSYMNNISKEQIRNIFHKLQETKKHMRLEETEAVKRNTNYTDKNRKGSDIPGDVHRPRLYLNQKPGASDYINAVYVNIFQDKHKYILAQSPLSNTVANFLALVVQTDCACIVNFESTSATRNDFGVYVPPDNKVLKKGIFNVRCSKPDVNAYRIKRTLTIDYHGKELCLTNLEFTDWNKDFNLPNSPSDFRQLIAEVDIVTANTNADRPVLIHCLDGASKCALFSVVGSLLQTLEVEHEVSIVNAVRKVRSRRKGAIPNSEQFQFCHDCVLDYIKSSNTHSKFVADL